jgi:hypothetical protein
MKPHVARPLSVPCDGSAVEVQNFRVESEGETPMIGFGPGSSQIAPNWQDGLFSGSGQRRWHTHTQQPWRRQVFFGRGKHGSCNPPRPTSGLVPLLLPAPVHVAVEAEIVHVPFLSSFLFYRKQAATVTCVYRSDLGAAASVERGGRLSDQLLPPVRTHCAMHHTSSHRSFPSRRVPKTMRHSLTQIHIPLPGL